MPHHTVASEFCHPTQHLENICAYQPPGNSADFLQGGVDSGARGDGAL